ncbi:MAG: Gfo/Idh/MocA family oxidoreductase [Clostridiales bacterium]|nr:Gfo/Idh/MocA family oxidoreductase [Clostridiales bacterium]
MKQFKAAIVGCGHVSPMHGLSISMLDNVELVAVCDKVPEKAQEKAAAFGAKRWYSDLDEMLEKEELDTLHICLPHYLHPIVAIKALKKGINVLTEKPMATNCEAALEMIEAEKVSTARLAVVSQNRYNAGAVLIKNLIDDGTLGKLLGMRATLAWIRTPDYYQSSDWKGTWDKEGGGVIIDQAIHTIDMLRYLAKSPVDYIDATIANRYHPYIDVEDVSEGVIAFKSGVMASFHCMNYYSYNAPVEIELQFDNAIARMVLDEGEVKFTDGRVFIAKRDPAEKHDFAGKNYWGINHTKQIAQFYQALETGEPFIVDGPEAYKTQQMVNAIYTSGKEHRRVYID